MDTRKSIYSAAEFVKSRIGDLTPEIGIVLGSGLGKLGGLIEDPIVIPYSAIPDFPQSTAQGHAGNFLVGHLSGRTVIAMQGRIHYYEGYAIQQTVIPIRVMKLLGIKYLFVSNAAGGSNPAYKVGDLMIIRDHINLLPNPLIGPNMDEFGPRFPDMTRPYDLGLIRLAKEVAAEQGVDLREGVYISCTGPTFETPGEYRFFRTIGADAVGMSTTPEVIVARHSGIAVFGMSVITDVATDNPDDYVTDHLDIIKAADAAADKMSRLFATIISRL